MPAITLKLDGPEDLTPIPEDATVHVVDGPLEAALVLGGMQSGAPSVMLRVQLPDGSVAIVQTSLAILEATAAAMRGRVDYLESGAGGPPS